MLPTDLAILITRAGIDPTLPERELVSALQAAIAQRPGYQAYGYRLVDDQWQVQVRRPALLIFEAATLSEALARCLVWILVTTNEWTDPSVRASLTAAEWRRATYEPPVDDLSV